MDTILSANVSEIDFIGTRFRPIIFDTGFPILGFDFDITSDGNGFRKPEEDIDLGPEEQIKENDAVPQPSSIDDLLIPEGMDGLEGLALESYHSAKKASSEQHNALAYVTPLIDDRNAPVPNFGFVAARPLTTIPSFVYSAQYKKTVSGFNSVYFSFVKYKNTVLETYADFSEHGTLTYAKLTDRHYHRFLRVQEEITQVSIEIYDSAASTIDSTPREINLSGSIVEYKEAGPAQQYSNSIENPLQYSRGNDIIDMGMNPMTQLQTFEDNAGFDHLVSMRFYDVQGDDSTQPLPEDAVFSFPELKIDTKIGQVSNDNYVPNPDVMQYAEHEVDINQVYGNNNLVKDNFPENREYRRQNPEINHDETVVQQDNIQFEELETLVDDGKYISVSEIMRTDRENISEDYQDVWQRQYIKTEGELEIAVQGVYSAARVSVVSKPDLESDIEPRVTYEFNTETEEGVETEVPDVYQVQVELQPSILEEVAGNDEVVAEILSPEGIAALKGVEPVAKSYLDEKIKTREMSESWKKELEALENEFQSIVPYAKIDMKTGEYEGHNDDVEVQPASMSKVGIMYALLYLSAKGELNLKDKVQNTQEKRDRLGTERYMDAFEEDREFTYIELIDLMIKKSSNYPASLILDAATHDKINGAMDEMGYVKTKFYGSYTKDGGYEQNRTTMKEMAYMMYNLINGKELENLDKEHKDLAINAMSNIIDYIVQADYDRSGTLMKHGQTSNGLSTLLKMQNANNTINHIMAFNVNSQQSMISNDFQFDEFGTALYNLFVDFIGGINNNKLKLDRRNVLTNNNQ